MKFRGRAIHRNHHTLAALRDDDGFPTCPYCDTPFYYMDGEVDHIRPHIDGGCNRKENLILVCGPCNREKGGMRFLQWVRKKKLHSPEYYADLFERLGKNLPPDLMAYINEA